jgi:thioredoxin 1
MYERPLIHSDRRRFLIACALAVVIIATVVLKSSRETTTVPAPAVATELPRLVDLGADKCVPCKMMAPILVELRTEYAGRFAVEFIDVWKDEAKAQEYGIRVIPTQIFYDADGKELLRHEGFFAKEEILAAWREHGYDFPVPAGS